MLSVTRKLARCQPYAASTGVLRASSRLLIGEPLACGRWRAHRHSSGACSESSCGLRVGVGRIGWWMACKHLTAGGVALNIRGRHARSVRWYSARSRRLLLSLQMSHARRTAKPQLIFDRSAHAQPSSVWRKTNIQGGFKIVEPSLAISSVGYRCRTHSHHCAEGSS